MVDKSDGQPPVVTLKYAKGDMIIKEGDYGISLYRILKGEVLLYTAHGEKEVPVALLGAGEVFGEIALLDKGLETFSCSARAIKDSELEAWHRQRFLKEYELMPPVFQYIVRQPLRRLAQTRKLIVRQCIQKAIVEAKEKSKQSWSTQQRRHYRKEVDSKALYYPVGTDNVRLIGQVRDISRQGIGMEVGPSEQLAWRHEIDDKFFVQVNLPNGQNVSFTARVVAKASGSKPGYSFLGMFITDISYENQKQLGFFLMP